MSKSLLNREIYLFHPLISAFILCLVSGLAIYLSPSLSWWAQFNLLGHIFFGILVSLLSLPYLFLHFKRTLGIRKLVVMLNGIVAALILIGYIYISLHLAIVGHKEVQQSYLSLHLYGGFVLVALIVSHILFHHWLKSRKDANTLHTLSSYPVTQGSIILGSYILILVIAASSYELFHTSPGKNKLTQDYQYSYGEHPFRPSQSETPNSEFVSESQIAGSKECAFCHTEIARQWFSSVHRQAASDPAYVTNIELLEKNKGISATRYCEGCHAPIALLTGQLTPGGKHGGVVDTTANQEGVSCLSCHRITRAVHLDGVGSFYFEPAQDYLFQYSKSSALKQINRYLIKVYTRQHQKDMAQPVLAQPAHCATCHAQFMDKDMNDWGWVKMQDDYTAWLNSPYSRQHQQSFASQEIVRCQDCHMPLVTAQDPSADASGKVRSHRFLAANTMLPFLNKDTIQLAQTKSFLQSNKLHIAIEPTNRKSATQSSLNLDESLRLHKETPEYFYLGETIELDVIVSNTGVGHDFPGGTIDINEAWVYILVRDTEGRTIYQSGSVDKKDQLDTRAHRYLSIPINRQGKAVWRHDLFNMTGETYRNVIKAGGSDVISYQFTLPYWTKGPLVVDALLKFRKLNTRYAKWALNTLYQPLPIVVMAKDNRIIEVRHEPRVITPDNPQSLNLE